MLDKVIEGLYFFLSEKLLFDQKQTNLSWDWQFHLNKEQNKNFVCLFSSKSFLKTEGFSNF